MNRRAFLRGLACIAAPAIITPAGVRAGLWVPPARRAFEQLTLEEFVERVLAPSLERVRQAVKESLYAAYIESPGFLVGDAFCVSSPCDRYLVGGAAIVVPAAGS